MPYSLQNLDVIFENVGRRIDINNSKSFTHYITIFIITGTEMGKVYANVKYICLNNSQNEVKIKINTAMKSLRLNQRGFNYYSKVSELHANYDPSPQIHTVWGKTVVR